MLPTLKNAFFSFFPSRSQVVLFNMLGLARDLLPMCLKVVMIEVDEQLHGGALWQVRVLSHASSTDVLLLRLSLFPQKPFSFQVTGGLVPG